MSNLLLEQYLEQVAAKLKVLPMLAQEHQIAEIQQHLETMIAGAQAQGISEESATKAAIRQFGMASCVGADLRRTGLRQRLLQLPDFVIAFFICLVLNSVILPSLQLLMFANLAHHTTSHSAAGSAYYLGNTPVSLIVQRILVQCMLSLLFCGLFFTRLGNYSLRYLLTRPIIREAVGWSLLTGVMQIVGWCWIFSLPNGEQNLWMSFVSLGLPMLLVLLRPGKTPSGAGVAAATLANIPVFILTGVMTFPSDLEVWRMQGTYLASLFVRLMLPLLLITILRLRVELSSQGWRSARVVLK